MSAVTVDAERADGEPHQSCRSPRSSNVRSIGSRRSRGVKLQGAPRESEVALEGQLRVLSSTARTDRHSPFRIAGVLRFGPWTGLGILLEPTHTVAIGKPP